VLGNGCVYPASTGTLMGQLAAKQLSWKAYIEGIDEGGQTAPACAHPASGTADPSATSPTGTTYQTLRNPIVYFHSIVDSPTCATNDVGMSALEGDLRSEKRTASFSYIAPGPCDDGSPTPCAPGRASGMMAADAFLRRIVPKILSSKAYKHGGLLAITVDDAPVSGEFADSSSCCGQPRFANLPAPTGAAALSPPAGGQVGLLLLATIEQAFGLSRLGYAGLSEVKPLSPSLFSGG
jgi:hypothetical protein